MKAYKRTEDPEGSVTYEFRTIYLYVMYAILLVMLVGFATQQQTVGFVGLVLMALYALFVSLPMVTTHQRIRQAMKVSKVEATGSKWSFSQPLKLKISKDVDETRGTLSRR